MTDPQTETIGGNAIQDQNINLHSEWDDIPTDIGEAATKELLADAQSTPATPGAIEGWPKDLGDRQPSCRAGRVQAFDISSGGPAVVVPQMDRLVR